MKRRLGSERLSPPAGFEPETPLSEVWSVNRSATRSLQRHKKGNSKVGLKGVLYQTLINLNLIIFKKLKVMKLNTNYYLSKKLDLVYKGSN